jgi:adenine-specific DNA-methyltransferase
MLNVESDASPSLLNIDRFEDPFNYTMQIATGTVGETRSVTIDLVETFNYLIGLQVRCVRHSGDFTVIEGRDPETKEVLVIWRNTTKTANANLDEFVRNQHYNTRTNGFDIIYVNGDNNLENLRLPGEQWQMRLIEEEFQRLMFDVKDV